MTCQGASVGVRPMLMATRRAPPRRVSRPVVTRATANGDRAGATLAWIRNTTVPLPLLFNPHPEHNTNVLPKHSHTAGLVCLVVGEDAVYQLGDLREERRQGVQVCSGRGGSDGR